MLEDIILILTKDAQSNILYNIKEVIYMACGGKKKKKKKGGKGGCGGK